MNVQKISMIYCALFLFTACGSVENMRSFGEKKGKSNQDSELELKSNSTADFNPAVTQISQIPIGPSVTIEVRAKKKIEPMFEALVILSSTEIGKCGVNSFAVAQPCGNGHYSGATYQCHGGENGGFSLPNSGNGTRDHCQSSEYLQKLVQQSCAKSCSSSEKSVFKGLTNKEGLVHVSGVAKGVYKLTVLKDGYLKHSADIKVNPKDFYQINVVLSASPSEVIQSSP